MTTDPRRVRPALRALAEACGAHGALAAGEATREAEHYSGRKARTMAIFSARLADRSVPIAHSSSHHAGVAVAVAIADPTGRLGIGVDLDSIGRLPDDDAAFVLDDGERAAAAAIGADAMVPWALKEATFKAVSGATPGGLVDLDPGAVRVQVHGDGTAAVALGDAAGTVEVVDARWCVVDGAVLAVATARWTGT